MRPTALITAVFFAALQLAAVPAPSNSLPAAAAVAPSGELTNYLACIDQRARTINSFKAQFKQTVVDPAFDETDIFSGTLCLVKKSGGSSNAPPVFLLRFDYLVPEQSVTIVNESKVIVHRSGFEPEETMLQDDVRMQSLMAGFTSVAGMRAHFQIALGSVSSNQVVLDLTPVSDAARKTLKSLNLTFDKATWLLRAAHQWKLNDQEITFAFEQCAVNVSVPAELFTAASLAPKDVKKPGDR